MWGHAGKRAHFRKSWFLFLSNRLGVWDSQPLKFERVSLRIRITKHQFDKIADSLKEIIVSEIDSIKEHIDINNDGYVEIREFKLVIKSLIKALKMSIKGLK